MKKGKILVIRWGQVRIHEYFLANLLHEKGYEVDFAVYTPSYAYKNEHIISLFEKIKDNFRVYEFKESYFKKQLIRTNTLLNKIFNKSYLPFFIGYLLPSQLRKKINPDDYLFVIPVEQTSLYWTTQAWRIQEKLIYYSLEIQKKGDDDISINFEAIIRKELEAIHAGIYALIIQDKFRAESLVSEEVQNFKFKIAYLPVFVEGDAYTKRNNYFHIKFGIQQEKKILLYFGEVYTERKLPQLISAFKAFKNKDYVLVFHGSKLLNDLIGVNDNIFVSQDFLPFDQINAIISSAHMGIAFYDNKKLNSRFTAFSSEKITRYLQCGIPFVAFNNESYQALNAISECAYLIKDFTELETAIVSIDEQYDLFSSNAFNAYKFFSKDSALNSLNAVL
ncbi:MAG: hypothetical protein WBP08_00075 [Saprospiraceae bacterium]